MNVISVVLVFAAVTAATYFVFKMQEKIRILEQRNQLYLAFVKNTSVKQFLLKINKLNSRAIDSDLTFMFQRYFYQVLIRLGHENVPKLLADIRQSLYSGILTKALVRAVEESDDVLFGLALSEYVDSAKERTAIEFFLTHLSNQERKRQYVAALCDLEKEYNQQIIDLPFDARRSFEEVMKSFKEKIDQLS